VGLDGRWRWYHCSGEVSRHTARQWSGRGRTSSAADAAGGATLLEQRVGNDSNTVRGSGATQSEKLER
jgi:hypothetical protein